MNPLTRLLWSIRRRLKERRLRRVMPMDVFSALNMPLIFQCLYVVTELGVADLLKKRPMTAEELARETGASPKELLRVMRALNSVGFFGLDAQGRFSLTSNVEPLCVDAPFSISHWYRLAAEVGWSACDKLLEAVKTGGYPFRLAHQADCWDLYEKNERLRKIFDMGMSNWTILHNPPIVEAFDLKHTRELIDIGGGRGTLMVALLKANPHLKGIVFDRPEAAEVATAYIAEAGLADRCRFVGGSFLEKVPEGDAYTIKHALHDWPNEFALQVLKTIRAAIRPGGRLVIIDAVLDPRPGADQPGKWLDISQFVGTTGGVRTEEDFRELLGAAGFELRSIEPTRSEECQLLECRPV